jgi:hypothetical protein
VKFQLATAAAAALFVGLSLLSGEYRRPALAGALISGVTAVASILAMGRAVRTARKPSQQALLVFVVAFLVRLVLVGLGTVLVARGGEQAVAFVVAFFVPYFTFVALEGAFIHSLRRSGT